MANYVPPTENLPIFDSSVFDTAQNENLTYSQATGLFLTYPTAQGDETLQNITVNGVSNFNGSLVMPDGTTQTSAYTGGAILAGSYTNTNITVNNQGKITALANGSVVSTPTLANVLLAGNSAGATNLNMNGNFITGCQELDTVNIIATNAIQGASFVSTGATEFNSCVVDTSLSADSAEFNTCLIDSTFTATGNATFNATLTTAGNATFNSTLITAGNATFNSGVILGVTAPLIKSTSTSNPLVIQSGVGQGMTLKTGGSAGISTTLDATGILTLAQPPVMSGASITANTIPITSVVGTAVVLSGAQTIAGAKTFSSAITASAGVIGNASTATTATTATTAGSCSGNSATATTATTAGSCSGNASTATTATNQSGGTVSATTGTFGTSLLSSGNLSVNGGFYQSYGATITATVTLALPLNSIYLITSATVATVTLPTTASNYAGIILTFRRKTSAATITFNQTAGGVVMVPYNSNTPATTVTFTATQFSTSFTTDGVNWFQLQTI